MGVWELFPNYLWSMAPCLPDCPLTDTSITFASVAFCTGGALYNFVYIIIIITRPTNKESVKSNKMQ